MREIKFRFFNGAEMIHNIIGYDFNCGGPVKDVLAVWDGRSERVDYYDIDEDLVLMQYTGLKDVAGNEIYEGDIVKYHNLEEGKAKLGMIEFSNGCYFIDETLLNRKSVAIVGNIYENKDLLEVTNE